MGIFEAIAELLKFINKKTVGRNESRANEIESIKKEMLYLQRKTTLWTSADSALYSKLGNRLSKLESEAKNARTT